MPPKTPTQADSATRASLPKPVLKWAGGKRQLLGELDAAAPQAFAKYIEPFVGGGAYFFHLAPEQAVVADSNAELVSLYRTLVTNAEAVASALTRLRLDEESYYEIRAEDWRTLPAVEAAARMLYLNRLGFNGLYRVNRKGMFNVPFGKYKNPSLPSAEALVAAGEVLARAEIVCGDYRDVLHEHATPGDFVFLDPPYVPISEYSDFKRYTADQFREDNHEELAAEFRRLVELGCYVVLTNSDHPLVHDLFSDYERRVVATRRNINSKGTRRTGTDVIVIGRPQQHEASSC